MTMFKQVFCGKNLALHVCLQVHVCHTKIKHCMHVHNRVNDTRNFAKVYIYEIPPYEKLSAIHSLKCPPTGV